MSTENGPSVIIENGPGGLSWFGLLGSEACSSAAGGRGGGGDLIPRNDPDANSESEPERKGTRYVREIIYNRPDHRQVEGGGTAYTLGAHLREAPRKIGVSEYTYYRWRREYGGMEVEQATRLKKSSSQEHLQLATFRTPQ